MTFKDTECAKTILKGCHEALEAKSDSQRAKMLNQLLFYAKLQNAPKNVMVKLQVAAGSTEKKRVAHVNDIIFLLK